MDWDQVEDKIIWGERKGKEDSIESINSMELESLRIKTCMLLEWQLSWNMRENDQEVGRCLQKGGEVITDQDSKIQSWKILGKGKDNDLEIAMRSMDYTYFTFSPKNLGHLKETTTRDYSSNL